MKMKFTEPGSQSAEAQVEERGRGGDLESRGFQEGGRGGTWESKRVPRPGGSSGSSSTFAGSGEAPCDAFPFSRFAGL